MVVEKRLNNNVILVSEKGQMQIVMGKGIGFKAYPGDIVDMSLIEKSFIPTDGLTITQMTMMLNDIPIEDIQLTQQIIDEGEKIIGRKLNPNMLFSLQDHIRFTIERYKKSLSIDSPIQWEVRKFYPKEVQAARNALQRINDYFSTNLPDSEVIFIALHFVNGQMDQTSMQNTLETTEIIRSILQIIRYQFSIEVDEDSIAYNRFLTHLRYYLMRQRKGQYITIDSGSLYYTICDRFKEESECVDKIAEFLEKQCEWATSEDEKLYLILHLHALTMKSMEENDI